MTSFNDFSFVDIVEGDRCIDWSTDGNYGDKWSFDLFHGTTKQYILSSNIWLLVGSSQDDRGMFNVRVLNCMHMGKRKGGQNGDLFGKPCLYYKKAPNFLGYSKFIFIDREAMR